MKSRRFVISDIHGNYKALKQVLNEVKFDYEKDSLITMGDESDGYSETYEVIEELLKIKNIVAVKGNHSEWLRQHMENGFAENIFLSQGGEATLKSYKSHGYEYPNFPQSHVNFFNSAVNYYELDDMLFVHGGFFYPTHPKDTSVEVLTWDRSLLDRAGNGLRIKEWKKVFVGHTCLRKETVVVASDGISFLESKPKMVYGITGSKITENKITEYSHKSKKIIEIYANNIIEATKEHRLPILQNDKIIFQKVSKLKVGDLLLSPKKINIRGALQKLSWAKLDTKNFHNVVSPKILDKEVAYLLGIILGDGSVGERSIEISERYKNNMKMISELFDKKFNVKSNVSKRDKKNAYRVRINSTELVRNLDIKHNKKYFLELIGKSPSSVRIAFFSGLIDTDGHLGREISFSQKDKQVIDFVHSLLLAEGIHSDVSKSKNESPYSNLEKPTFCYNLRIKVEHNEACCNILKTKFFGKTDFLKYKNRKTRRMLKFYGDFILYPIRKIIPQDEFVDVIDISVEKSETFIANGICSHNSTENNGATPWTNYCGRPKKGMAKIINVDCGAGWMGRLCLWDIDTDKFVLSEYAERRIKK